jgi:Cytochrome oxidase complex assembly protein 1
VATTAHRASYRHPKHPHPALNPPPQIRDLESKEFASTQWLKRNWKWVVPAGVLVLVAFASAFMLGIAQIMKRSDAYRIAFTRACACPAVVERLGEPIREGWFLQGHINLVNNDGVAELSFPLVGPKAEATVYVVATKTAGRWHFRSLVVGLDGGLRDVDLSDPEYRHDRQQR